MFVRFSCLLPLTAALLATSAPAAFAQQSPGFFMPPSASSAPSAPPVHHTAPAPQAMGQADAAADAATAQAQPKLPPIPELPALPKGNPPPEAIIGVLSVPDVMQQSTAAQGVQQIVQQRRAKLVAEAQADQAGWQSEQNAITSGHPKLTDAQLATKEKALQDEIAAAQTSFRARDQAIQNSAQVALGQIESELIAVIRQVAQARGMNLVLHREQVALNVNEFDITNDVVAELNKLLPSVPVPPSVVTPGMPISPPANDGQDQGQ